MKLIRLAFFAVLVVVLVSLAVSTTLNRKVKSKTSLARKTLTKAPLLGIKGQCVGAKGTLQSTKQKDSFIKNAYDAVLNNVSALLDNPNICFGDFVGDNWNEENDSRVKHLEDDLCYTMALDDDKKQNYSIFSFSVPHIPCGDSTDATMTACFMTNDKACIGIAANTEIAGCLLSYIPDPYGITKIIGLLKDVIPQVVFVVCPERGIEEDFKMMLYDQALKDNKPMEQKVEIKGSIQFSLGLAVPGDWLKLTKIPGIDKIVEVTGICTYIYDFGAKATDFINLLKTKKIDKLQSFVDLFDEAIKKLNPSVLFVCDGKITFGLAKFSLQMLPDLEITLAKCNLLINYQKKGLLPAGIHFSCEQDIIKDIEAFIKEIFDKFKLGSLVKLPSSKVSLSISIHEKGIMIVIELSPKLPLACYISSKGKIRCQLDQVIFEMFKKGAEIVIKEVAKFIDDAMDKVEDFAVDAVKEIEKVKQKVEKAIKEQVNKIGNEVKKTAEKVYQKTKSIAKNIGKAFKTVGKEIEKFAKKAAKEIKDFFSSWR